MEPVRDNRGTDDRSRIWRLCDCNCQKWWYWGLHSCSAQRVYTGNRIWTGFLYRIHWWRCRETGGAVKAEITFCWGMVQNAMSCKTGWKVFRNIWLYSWGHPLLHAYMEHHLKQVLKAAGLWTVCLLRLCRKVQCSNMHMDITALSFYICVCAICEKEME